MRRAVSAAVICILLLSACSGSEGGGDGGPTVLGAGDIVVDLPDDPTPAPDPTATPVPADDTEETAEDGDGEDGGNTDEGTTDGDGSDETDPGDGSDDGTGEGDADAADDSDDIPLNENEETFVEQAEGLFNTIDDFSECLATAGFEFLGVPEADMPEDDPRANPNYIQALTTCAAETNIVSAFENADFSSDSLSPEEIEARNAGYVYFEACLTVRGWTLGEATPDANGMLQLPDQFEPPAGETLIGTDDLRECLAEANQNVEADLAEESS
ncbi:MAG: hypothetical protein AAF567_05945 [Actinomycetota bacterium]